MTSDKRNGNEAARIIEDAEEGLHGRLDDPNTPPEVGPVERGRVDAGPTGERDGYREPESSRQIMLIGGIAVVVILVVLVIAIL